MKGFSGITTGEVFTSGQAAKVLMCSHKTVVRLCDSDRLKHWKIPPCPGGSDRLGDLRITKSELIRFAKEGGIPLPKGFADATIKILTINVGALAEELGTALGGRFAVSEESNTVRAGMIYAEERPAIVIFGKMKDVAGKVASFVLRSDRPFLIAVTESGEAIVGCDCVLQAPVAAATLANVIQASRPVRMTA